MSHLLPCPACHRHIDAIESVCPFCAAALPAGFAATPARVMPPRRLGRAALMAAGATLWTAACSGESLGGAKDASAVTTGAGGTVAPAYGAPVRPGTGGSTGAGGTAVAAYGGPIPTGGSFGSGGATGAGGSSSVGGTSGSTDGAAPDGASDAPHDASQDRSVIAIYGLAAPDSVSNGSGGEPQS